jgi:2,3-bisphosphoglycerate-independent phosphoglycerate mutase
MNEMAQPKKNNRRVLAIVLDGVGISQSEFGNAVGNACTPNLNWLRTNATWTTLAAHGKSVGLPSDSDIGNSEVGHNALGAGRIFDQGAKLVQNAIQSGSIFKDQTWIKMLDYLRTSKGTLHFLGLLSDGNVHAHQDHLHAMIRQAKKDGIKKVRIHALLDGRDVGEKTAEVYADRLQQVIAEEHSADFDVCVASGGGRMTITMDRYEADWNMVKKGWDCHVKGIADHQFSNLKEAIAHFRKDATITDQYIPAFVIQNQGKPSGAFADHDAMVFFNFRGDRAIEISRAFTESNFSAFDRGPLPECFYAGMMQYDGDLNIPEHFLVSPPAISDTLSEHLAKQGIRQFACSETQKFGHVTYFWNGNRSGYFDKSTEEYLEIKSDSNITFDRKPWMKAYEITEETIKRMQQNSFDFARINFANGDMVGHTGNYEAAVVAVETVDLMLGRLIEAAKQTNTILLVTADHGNADEMFDAKSKDFPDWKNLPLAKRPTPKTAHTINPVPFAVYDPSRQTPWPLNDVVKNGNLGHIANTALTLMGLPTRDVYLPSLVKRD